MMKVTDVEYIVHWDRKTAVYVALKIIIAAIFKGRTYYKFCAKECNLNITEITSGNWEAV